MLNSFLQQLEEMPIIAAVKNDQELQLAITTECQVVFVLYGDICNIAEIVKQIKQNQKTAIVHVDLVDGLENKLIAIEFIKQYTLADGIISTKSNLIQAAKERGLWTIQRFFMIDSIALENMKRHLKYNEVDMIEILPGVMPKVIQKIVQAVEVPVIAGGLVSDKEDVISALSAGAIAVSTTLRDIWEHG